MSANFFAQVIKDANKAYALKDADTGLEERVALNNLKGPKGDIGESINGDRGEDGRGIIGAELDKQGFLHLTYTDGRKEKIAKVNGKDGRNGTDGAKGGDGLPGPIGLPGRDGKNGRNGRGIDDAVINEKGELIVLFSDGEQKNLGRVVGRDGQSIETRVGGVIDTAGLGLTGQMFRSIAVSGQPTVNAKTYRDTLTLVQGSNITLVTNAKNRAVTISSTSGNGSSVTKNITQTAHGFVIGNVLKYTGTAYAKALADSAADGEVIGIVSAIIDINNFTILTAGYISGLSGLTAGTVYFLDPITSGALTATEPTTSGQISKPLLVTDSTSSGYFINYRGLIISSSDLSSPTRLITIPGINGKTIANTALYTVPVGFKAIITGYRVRCSAATSITTGAAAGIGNIAGTNNISASQAMNALQTTTDVFQWEIVGMTISTAAAGVIYFNLGTAAIGTSQTLVVDLMGYLV